VDELFADRVSLRDVLDSLPRAVIVTDGEGRIALWNAAAEDLYGWREDEVRGRSIVDVLTPPDHHDEHVARLQRVLEGESTKGDRILVRRDGQPIRVAVTAQPLLDEAGEVVAVVGTSEDITPLRVLERNAQDLTDHLRLALDSAGLGTWQWDKATGEVTWDERMEALFGFAPGTFDGTFEAYVASIHPHDRAATLATVEAAMATGEAYRIEHRATLADGTVRWITGSGKPTVDATGATSGVIGCSMDNTEVVMRRLENRRLDEAQRLIATTLQHSLLPERLPDIAGMDVAVRYWAVGEATQVGGDFYDLFPHAEGSWAAVVGDVCGTGPAAAALTGLARHTIRQSVWRGDDPAGVLSWVNRAMLESTQDGFLTAACLDVVRRGSGFTVEAAAAGHPLPVLVPAEGDARFVGAPGTLVGVFETIKVNPVSFDLDPGDTLVLYTDGVTDVAPPHDLTDEALLAIVARCVREADDAEGTADAMHEAIAGILPLERREDDIALLVLRVTAPG